MYDPDAALDAVAQEVGVGNHESSLVAQPPPAADLRQRRHGFAL